MDTWVRLGAVRSSDGRLVITDVPVPDGVATASTGVDVTLGVDLRPTHDLAGVVVRGGSEGGVYQVEGRLAYDGEGAAHLSEVRIVFPGAD